ncbi:MAG: bacterial Ig-like domain-containing protein [Bacilli bacterium]|nr:bacterial Ig-like domain-containing protein [Bacilli bacterium]
MKKTLIKSILLGAMTLGMMIGCNEPTSSTSNPVTSSSTTSSTVSSSSSEITSSITTSSSDSSSSASSSLPSSSSSSSSSSVAPTLTGITLDTTNVKKTYIQGEALDLTGLVVTAKYSDNTTEAVTNYTTNPANGAALNNTGAIPVTVAYGRFTDSFNVIVTKAPKAAWTEEEAKLMSDHLYGEVLPYTGFEASQVVYNEQYKAVVIIGGTITDETLESYARALSFNGYILVSTTELVFEKSVQTDAGKRIVQVSIMDNKGQLAIVAMDPYYYAFPTDFANYVADKYFTSKDAVPAIQADYYQLIEGNDGIAIVCYMDATTDDAGYSDILTTANWTVLGKDEHELYSAVSPDSAYMISYEYSAQNGALLIVFRPVNFFNDAPIKAFFAKYNGTYVELPALNIPNGQYYFEEADTNEYFFEKGEIDMVVAFLTIYGGAAEDAKNYMTTLQEAGFKVLNSNDSYSATKAVEGKGLFRLDYSYDPEKGVITLIFYIYLEPFPTTEFPQDEISELLGGYTTDIVPGYTGETTGFQLNDDSYGTYIVVQVEQGTEEEAIASYTQTLLENGYRLENEGGSVYVSEHHEIFVQMYKDSGSFKIVFYRAPYLSWPSTQIAAYLGEEINDVVPAFADADADEFTFEPDDDGLWITVGYNYEEDDQGEEIEFDMEEISSAYIEELEDADYTAIEVEDTTYYVSKNLEVVISIDYDDIWDEIYIFINSVRAVTAGQWPAYHLTYFLNAHNYTDELPVYEGEFVSADARVTLSALTIDVVLETTDAEELKAAADTYIDTLEEAGFTYFEELGEGACKRYLSPNEEYEVSVMYQPNGFTVQIDEIANERQETTTFPTEALFAAHPELEGVLPVVVEGEAAFDTQIQSDWVEIYVTYEDTSLIAGAMEAYKKSLEDAGLRAQEDTAGYDVVYFSPDGTYYVCVTDWSDYDPAGFDIEIYYL